MKRFTAILFAILICAAIAHADQPEASLCKRLGGYDALAAVTDDFIGRLATDPMLGKFFVGHSQDSLQRIRQLIVDQLCAATGGPGVYLGRDMKNGAQRHGHHPRAVGRRGRTPRGHARQVQSAGAREERSACRDRDHGEGHRRGEEPGALRLCRRRFWRASLRTMRRGRNASAQMCQHPAAVHQTPHQRPRPRPSNTFLCTAVKCLGTPFSLAAIEATVRSVKSISTTSPWPSRCCFGQ